MAKVASLVGQWLARSDDCLDILEVQLRGLTLAVHLIKRLLRLLETQIVDFLSFIELVLTKDIRTVGLAKLMG
jgi:hypothetical protein